MTAAPNHRSDLVRAAELAEALAELAEARDMIANLEIALESSREIGTAIGILMATRKVTHDQAFGLLRTASQHQHVKLRDVAEGVIFTGTVDMDNDDVESTPRDGPSRWPSDGR